MYGLTSGNYNTCAGFQSGNGLTSASYCVNLGYQAGANNATSWHQLYISNSNREDALIRGNFFNEELTINGSLEITKAQRSSAIETITASSDTLDDTNFYVRGDCTSNDITINLPTAVGNEGLTYIIKKVDSTGNTITIDANSTQTIDGEETQTITQQYTSVKIISNGTNWDILEVYTA